MTLYRDVPGHNTENQTQGTVSMQIGSNGAAHVHAGMDNLVKRVPADGAYTAKTVYGIWVAKAPTADDTAITPVNGAALTGMEAALFTAGVPYPVDATSVTVGTGGVFYLWVGP